MSHSVVHVCSCPACQSEAEEHAVTRALHHQVNLFMSRLDEQQRRWYCALESKRLGHGGEQLIARITGVTEKTIRRGRRELAAELADSPVGRIRHAGGGRPAAEVRDPELESTLERLLARETAGNPQGRGKYKRSSLRQLSRRLAQGGHRASADTVGRLVRKLGYSPRVNARRKEAKSSPPERDTQFNYIDERKEEFLAKGEPVISVDTKKKS